MDINIPIGCGDVAVFPGDIIVGDDDGVMVIPLEIADEVAEDCLQMTQYENFVLEKVNNGAKVIGLYPLIDESIKKEFEEWKKK